MEHAPDRAARIVVDTISAKEYDMEPNCTRYVSDIELEALYGINRRTWQQWRFRGQGPRYSKAGRLVRYDVRDVEAWLAAHKTQEPIAA